jgi:hypothetical protein
MLAHHHCCGLTGAQQLLMKAMLPLMMGVQPPSWLHS